jgi:N-methylhydantoinase B
VFSAHPPSAHNTNERRAMQMDPVTLEIMCRKFGAVADEMTSNLKRASRSVYVKEAGDFGTALVDRDGHVFAYPDSTSVSAIERPCGPSIREVPDLKPGDVIMTNDPYRSGGLATHLPDLHLIQPYFHSGKIIAYGWCFIHFMDIGGRVPSSISPSSTEVFQEGLLVPPMKIAVGGELNEDLVGFIRANCRTPFQNIADIKAMLAALATGGQRIGDLIAQHGVETIVGAQAAVQDYAAAKTRAVLRRIPDGTYEFWDFMDNDLVTDIPLRFRVSMTVEDGEVTVDVSNTDPQVKAAYNIPTQGGRHPWLVIRLTRFILTHDKTMPLNFGIYRHIKAVNPPGTVVHAEFPDAVGVRHAAAQRLNDALNGVILKAVPDLMSALTSGAIVPVVLAESDAQGNNRNITVIEPLVGGMGAYLGHDGVDTRDNSAANLSNHPLETIEEDIGVIVRRYDIRPDSGGAGKWRGGSGQILSMEILKDGGKVLARGMERMRFPSWGYGGAKPAQAMRCVLNMGCADEKELGKIDELPVKAGDTVTFFSPGGSGYGDPYQRDPEAVRRDVETGFVTHQAAAADYGVVVSKQGAVDKGATDRRRAARVKDNIRADFDFGPEREAWEAVFDDPTMCDLNRRLYALPKSVRQDKRRAVFEHAVPELAEGKPLSLAKALADPDAVKARLKVAMAINFGAGAAAPDRP